MNKTTRPLIACAVLAFFALLVMAANPAFQDFNANQFLTTGNKVSIKSGVLLTNANFYQSWNFIGPMGNTATGAVLILYGTQVETVTPGAAGNFLETDGTSFFSTNAALAALFSLSPTTNTPAANEFVTARWVTSQGTGQFTNVLQVLTWLSFDQTAGSGLTNVIVDFSKGNEFALILTTNAFFATPTNRPATNWTMSGMIRLYQDAVGVRSVSFTNGATTGAWKTPGAQTLVCTTNAGAASLLSYTVSGFGTNQWYVWGLNFQ